MGTFAFIRDRLRARRERGEGPRSEILRRQHDEIHLRLARAQVQVAERTRLLDCGKRAAAERRASVRAMAELEAYLVSHFQLEETGGYMSEALRLAPRYHGRAEDLREQHETLACQMRALCELAEISGPSREAWSELDRRLARFGRELLAHERAENELTSQIFLEDIGTAG